MNESSFFFSNVPLSDNTSCNINIAELHLLDNDPCPDKKDPCDRNYVLESIRFREGICPFDRGGYNARVGNGRFALQVDPQKDTAVLIRLE